MFLGKEEIIFSLLEAPKLSTTALILLLPKLLEKRRKKEIHRIYTAECLRILTENTAKLSNGSYLKAKYENIVNPPKEEKRKPDDIINKISCKLDKLGGGQN